jgi:hypothetical protein
VHSAHEADGRVCLYATIGWREHKWYSSVARQSARRES